jgi:hypothetical protein
MTDLVKMKSFKTRVVDLSRTNKTKNGDGWWGVGGGVGRGGQFYIYIYSQIF